MIIQLTLVSCRLHGATTGGATKVGNMQVFATILRRSLRCSLLLDGHSMGKVNYIYTRQYDCII